MAKTRMLRDGKRPDHEGSGLAALSRMAGAALFIERLWPPFVWGLSVSILFLAISWVGVWLVAPRTLRIAGVTLFTLSLAAALAPLLRQRWPGRRDVLARLDRDSGDAHHPATSFVDELANNRDPVAQALWARHQAQLKRSVSTVRVALPKPFMAGRDPYALRFAVPLLAFGAASAAGPELYGRLVAAFDWRDGASTAAAAESRIDAWIDPPAYAGRPPMVITLGANEPQELKVFEDSVLVVRADSDIVQTRVEGKIEPIEGKPSIQHQQRESRWAIRGDGAATILGRGKASLAAIHFVVTPVAAPTIKLIEESRANLSGSVTLAYQINDGFGVTGAQAQFALPHDASKPAHRSLAEPPQASLQLPLSENGTGEGHTTADLSEHPWAGALVSMTLSAHSVTGRTGSSAPVETTLPQRTFHNPLARALVEERRDLILDPDHATKPVEAALAGLQVAPELFGVPSGVYMGLNQARTSLLNTRNDADLLNVAALLWAMASQIEDGDASQAERDLRDAEKALREALKKGASDDEITKLMQDLREAAKRFASEMARKAEQNGDQSARDTQGQTQDLDKLMDRMEEAARNGTREEAEALLNQMQDMFENLREAGEESESPAERALQKQMSEIDKLLHDQQSLRDDTFRSDQRDRERRRAKRSDGEEGAQPGGNGNPSRSHQGQADSQPDAQQANPDNSPLEQRQRALRDRLAELQRQMKNLGMKGEKGFEDAEKHMGEAESDLGGKRGQGKDGSMPQPGQPGDKGAAVEAQGRAIEAMREGADGMQKQMGQGQGKGGRGKGGYSARFQRPGEGSGDDPLGRGREGNLGRDEGSLGENSRCDRAGAPRYGRVTAPSRRSETPD